MSEFRAFTAEELQDRMQLVLSRLETANATMKSLQKKKTAQTERAKLIVYSQRTDLITNDKLRAHLESIKISKTRITKEIAEGAVYIECEEVLKEYLEAYEESKRAKEEQDILKTMIMEYQSKRKFRGIELEVLGKDG